LNRIGKLDFGAYCDSSPTSMAVQYILLYACHATSTSKEGTTVPKRVDIEESF